MTKKTIEKFYSDLGGEEINTADPTVKFSFAGTAYEIDLTEAERSTLTNLLTPYLSASRIIGRKAPQRSGPPASDVRAWAIEQGIQIPTKGRIPLEIQTAYDKTH